MSQLPSSAFVLRSSPSHRWVKGVACPAQISPAPRPLPCWPGSAGPGLRAEPPVTAAQQGHLPWILCEGSRNSHYFNPPTLRPFITQLQLNSPAQYNSLPKANGEQRVGQFLVFLNQDLGHVKALFYLLLSL